MSVLGRAFAKVIAERQAIKLLDALTGDHAHDVADETLLTCVSPEVRQAYERARRRLGWSG